MALGSRAAFAAAAARASSTARRRLAALAAIATERKRTTATELATQYIVDHHKRVSDLPALSSLALLAALARRGITSASRTATFAGTSGRARDRASAWVALAVGAALATAGRLARARRAALAIGSATTRDSGLA